MSIPEGLGAFYLGKVYDLSGAQLTDAPIVYDARDLTTHAVCVGMTGSGKTGLCIDLLEEAAIDQVPAIIIDPKGDITNLLLTFPELRPEDFEPWVNVDDARRKDMTVQEYAARQAETWRNGLAEWGQGPDRIRLLRESADFTIYTPGSDAGISVSILSSLAAPKLSWDDNQELLREQISGTAGALLGLAGIEADPVRSREHILLANIFEHYWRQGADLDLRKLILAIQDPPVKTLGVFDVDTFFPEKDRFELAMALNNIIASPGFSSWIQGVPMDVDHLLYGGDAKPNVSIFYIAHLSDAERMFFVTLLLDQVISWMRAQAGTTSLRALLYMDEVFGFFPPVSEPPSKRPLLTLLKQARAFGLGVILTTQNPVDLDYKGLTNAGTWFIGKLQAERDKARVLEGLESVSAESGARLNRSQLDKMISSLGSRVFLMHNVHEDEPVTFMTRWAMSYLRGPLTRAQVRTLMADQRAGVQAQPLAAVSQPSPGTMDAITSVEGSSVPAGLSTTPPSLPHDVQQVFLPLQRSLRQALRVLEDRLDMAIDPTATYLVCEPRLIGMGTVNYFDQKRNVNTREDVSVLVNAPGIAGVVHWDQGERLDLAINDLSEEPEPAALFTDVPDAVDDKRELSALAKDFSDHLYRNCTYPLLYNPALDLYSEQGEDERAFKIRAQQVAREKRDAEVDKLAQKYQGQIDRLEQKLTREELELAEDEAEYSARKQEELLGAGESVFSMFFGRRRSSSLLSSASRRRRMTSQAKQDILESQREIESLKEQIAEMEDNLQSDTAEITERWASSLDSVEEFHVKPRRADVVVHLVALAWSPRWEITLEDRLGRPRTEAVSALA